MKNSRKIKKRFLALLGCAALGAVLAPAALAAEDLAAPGQMGRTSPRNEGRSC